MIPALAQALRLEVAASAAAANPLRILLTITLGVIPGFTTHQSFGAATGPSASTGRPPLAAVDSAANTAAVAAFGSTAAGSLANTPAADSFTAVSSKDSPDSASLTADSIDGADSSTTIGSTAATCSTAGADDLSPAGSATGSAVVSSAASSSATAAGSAAAELAAGTGNVLSLALTSTR